jgi:glycosyltransferase involved in cell wall biosynthesis
MSIDMSRRGRRPATPVVPGDDRLRIAYLHYLSGADTALGHVEQFATAARRLGHEIEVHAMDLTPTDSARNGNARSRLSGALKRRFGRYLHEPKELLWNARYVRKETELLATLRPDVLLVRNHGFIASWAMAARRLGIPVALEMNAPVEEATLYHDEYMHVPWVPVQLERVKVRRADAITVVSSSLRRHVIERYGADPGKIVVAPNGADHDLFRSDVPPDPEVANGKPGVVIGFVGSFHKWHGTLLLARMIRAVAAARPSARFLLVGDGPEASDVRGLIAELGDRVIWLGRVPHARIPALVASLDIGVMPESNFYGSPLKVIEWMAAARAVVAPDYAPLRDVIDSNTHGLLFPPGDLQALTSSIIRLIDEPALRESLGRAASARVRAELSWTANAQRVVLACRAARQRFHGVTQPCAQVDTGIQWRESAP